MVHVAHARALSDAGQWKGAVEEWQWVATHRGRAFAEMGTGALLDPITVGDTRLALLESATLLAKHDEKKRAEAALGAFDKAWPTNGLTKPLQARREAARAALLEQ